MAMGIPKLRVAALCLALLAMSAPTGRAQTKLAEPLGRQVITAELIRDAGVLRLGDVLAWVEGWGGTTVEGFTWQPSPRGLGLYGAAEWRVMLDGQVLNLNLFGVQSLNRIPVTLEEIDSIEVVSDPVLLNGAFSPNGTIRIHTRRPHRGPSLRSRIATANETGDPGPYTYTDLTSPNIDRIGTNISGWASYAGEGISVTAGGNWQEHFVTDPRIRVRNFDISAGEYPIIKQGSVSLRGQLEAFSGTHTVFLGHTQVRDYFFLKQYGREVPVQSPFTQVGLDGVFSLSNRDAIRYRVAYSSNALDQHANSLDIDFDWKLTSWSTAVEAVRHGDNHEATVGVNLQRSLARTGYALSRDDIILATAFGQIEYRLGWRSTQALTVAVTAGEDDLALAAAFAHRWLARGKQRIEFVLSFSERLPEQDSRIWLWHRRGYGFLPDNGVEVTLTSGPRPSQTAAADLRWQAQPARRLQLQLGAYIRSHWRLLLEAQPYSFDLTSHAFAGPVTVVADQNGDIAGGELAAAWHVTGSLGVRGHYRYQEPVGGSELSKAIWRTVPRHLARVTAQYDPWPSVGIHGTARYRSSSVWQDYAAADSQTDGLYRSRVDDALTIDLALQKWLWDQRMRLQLVFRNLLDDAVPHHPIGAAYGLSFAVQGELLLDAGR
jgi:hypothetical protein